MEVVAKRVGVPRATLYYYFSSKDQLFAFALERHMARLGEALREGLDTGGGVLDRLRSGVLAYLAAAASRPAAYLFLTTDLGRAERLDELSDRAQALIFDPLGALIEEGIATGELRELDVETAVSVLYGALNTSVMHHLARGGQLDTDTMGARLTDVLFRGLAR